MIIGVDPHKSTHTATAVDAATNTAVASVRVAASAAGYRRLLGWAQQFGERRCAVENARGLGCHLAQWLVAHGETVLDASTAATARVRELSRGGRRKNDVIDASAAASVAAYQGDAAAVAADDDTVVFALLEGASGEPGGAACALGQPAPRPAARPGGRWGAHRAQG